MKTLTCTGLRAWSSVWRRDRLTVALYVQGNILCSIEARAMDSHLTHPLTIESSNGRQFKVKIVAWNKIEPSVFTLNRKCNATP